MTVLEILERAAVLLDNVSVPEENETFSNRLLDALDSALCEISRSFPVQARCRIIVENGTAALPEQVLVPRILLREGKRVPLIIEEGCLVAEDAAYTLVYYRKPPKTKDNYDLELPWPIDIQAALPFYCAAVAVMGEDQLLYNQLMEQYNTKLAAALGYRPAANVEGGGML